VSPVQLLGRRHYPKQELLCFFVSKQHRFKTPRFHKTLDAAVEYDYNAVIEVCERALLLDNLTDPVEDLLGVGGMAYVDPSPVGRIEEVKKNLVNLMEQSKRNKKSTYSSCGRN
jgi:hypothetical protein